MPASQRALLICAGGGAGDVLLATPVARALRSRYEDVIALTAPAHCGVLEGNPDLRDIWVDAGSLRDAVGRVRAARFDVCVVTWSTGRCALIPFLAGIPRRVGQARRLYSWLYTDRVVVKSELGDRSTHWTQVLLDYARVLGCDVDDATPVLRVDPAARRAVDALRQRHSVTGRYIVLHPSRGLDLKGRPWPVATLARLAGELRARFALDVIVTGTAADRAIADAVAAGSGSLSFAGTTTFAELTALCAGAALCVAVDSGPMHVAAAVGTPTVGIFALASDEPKRWAPLGPWTAVIDNTYPCPPAHRKETCPDFACLRELDVARVVACAETLLAQRGAAST